MTCVEAMQVQAYADGELEATASVAVEAHLEHCAECAGLYADIVSIRKAMSEDAVYYRAGKALDRKIRAALNRESGETSQFRIPGERVFWRGALSGGAAAALAASLAFFILLPSAQDQIASDVVAAHLRSLMGTHLIDVASSNHHVVKPWFAGHADVSPSVVDYAKDGFVLVGGRVDYVHGERAAVANVFAWKDDGSARAGTRSVNGYRLVAWKSGDLFYCAVSDMGPDEMQALSDLIRKSSQS